MARMPRRLVGLCKGRKIDAILDSLQNFVRDQHGIREFFAAMDHAMADRVNVRDALNFM